MIQILKVKFLKTGWSMKDAKDFLDESVFKPRTDLNNIYDNIIRDIGDFFMGKDNREWKPDGMIKISTSDYYLLKFIDNNLEYVEYTPLTGYFNSVPTKIEPSLSKNGKDYFVLPSINYGKFITKNSPDIIYFNDMVNESVFQPKTKDEIEQILQLLGPFRNIFDNIMNQPDWKVNFYGFQEKPEYSERPTQKGFDPLYYMRWSPSFTIQFTVPKDIESYSPISKENMLSADEYTIEYYYKENVISMDIYTNQEPSMRGEAWAGGSYLENPLIFTTFKELKEFTNYMSERIIDTTINRNKGDILSVKPTKVPYPKLNLDESIFAPLSKQDVINKIYPIEIRSIVKSILERDDIFKIKFLNNSEFSFSILSNNYNVSKHYTISFRQRKFEGPKYKANVVTHHRGSLGDPKDVWYFGKLAPDQVFSDEEEIEKIIDFNKK